MKAAEVDEGVGAQEKIGDDGSNGVQLSWKKRKHSKVGLILFSVPPSISVSLSAILQIQLILHNLHNWQLLPKTGTLIDSPLTDWYPSVNKWYYLLTNENKADGNDVGQKIGSVWLVILPVAFPKEAN